MWDFFFLPKPLINTTSGLASRAHYLTSGSKSPYLRGERVGAAQRVRMRGQAPDLGEQHVSEAARAVQQRGASCTLKAPYGRGRCLVTGVRAQGLTQGAKVTTRIARQELLTRGWILSSQPLHKA